MSPVTVGVDIGTTSVKAVAVNDAGEVVARSRVPHKIEATADRLRHDADQAWRRGPRRALAALGDLRPRALTVTGMVPSMAAVNGRGRPISPGLLYGDAEGRPAERHGLPDLVGDAPEFLRALMRTSPDAPGYWSAQTTATVALGGPPVLAADVAQVLWPLVADNRWEQSVLDDCGVTSDQLPQIVGNRTPVADVEGMLLDGGAIDVACERVISCVEDGDALVICGSTLIVMASLPAGAVLPPAILAYPDETGALTATAASNAGGLFLNWVNRTVAKSSGVAEPDNVPVWVPYIRGERTPWNDPQRRAALADVHQGHDAAALRRGAFEASAFVARHLLELMDLSPRRIVAVGGGTQVDGWMQALADCVSVPVDAAAEPETAAIGAAFYARITAGLESTDLREGARWARRSRRFEPEPDWADATKHRYDRFRQLIG